MGRKKVFKFALISAIIGVCLLAIAYFFFHYVTDSGITGTHQSEAGKPFVTELIGDLSVLFLFTGAISSIFGLIFCEKED